MAEAEAWEAMMVQMRTAMDRAASEAQDTIMDLAA
jgi:hypothetical protein